MPVKSTIAATIGSILVNVISSDISDKKIDLVGRIKLNRFKLSNKKWINKFCKEHDGTVLTKGAFETYLKYHKPIENIYDYILKTDQQQDSVQKFLLERILECKEYLLSVRCVISVQDELILKDLYEKIDKNLRDFFSKQLTLKEKYIQSVNSHKVAEVNETIAIRGYKSDQQYEKIIGLLKEKNQINDDDIIWNIYETISNEVWSGRLEEIYMLLPLLEGKNNDLEKSVKIELEILSNYRCLTGGVVEEWGKIENIRISNDVARLLILFLLDDKDSIKLLIDRIKNEELREITEYLIQDKWENFLNVEIIEENYVSIQNYILTDKYQNEIWLIRRICAIHLYKQSVFNISNAMEALLKDKTNFVDEILITDKKEEQLISEIEKNSTIKKDAFIQIKTTLKSNQWKYSHSNEKLQLLFYRNLLRAMVVINCDEVIKEVENSPEPIKNHPTIAAFVMQEKIEKNEASEDQIIQFCMETGQYWLLNNYLIHLRENPENIVFVLEKCCIILEKDSQLFFLYLQAARITAGNDRVCELLDKYKYLYENYLEYWIEYEKSSFENAQGLISEIYIKWTNKEMSICSLHTEVEFIELLIRNNKYREADMVVKKLETLNVITPEVLRMKAKILLEEGYVIDALNILLKIFNDYVDDSFVVDTTIVLSLNNKRNLPQNVLDAAINLGSSRLWMLVALVYEKRDKHDEAFSFMTKALLRANEDNIDVFGNYFGLHIRTENQEIRKILGVDADTAVFLMNDTDKTTKIYCIYKDNVLPTEPYEWENAIHIYMDTAIQMDMLRKKNEMKVLIKGEEYVITEIMPVDCYLFRLCLEKLIKKGMIKQFSMDVNGDKMLNFDKFTDWINDNTSSSEGTLKWLENYKDLSNIPVPFFALQKFTRFTYEQLIIAFMEDNTIVIRELLHSDHVTGNSFVITFSALVMLYKIGVNLKYLTEKDVVITKSTNQEFRDESEAIIQINNKEHVSSMGVVDNHIFLQVSTDEEKIKMMKDATGLKKYAEQLRIQENDGDIRIDELENLNMIDTFGICDYDAIVLAQNSNRILVTGEISIMALTQFDGCIMSGIGIVDFLSTIKVELLDFIDYMIQMVKYRYLITLTESVINYLMTEYESISDDDARENILLKWINYLSLAEEMDENYKQIFSQMITNIYRNTYEEYGTPNNPLWSHFMYYVMKYNNLKINVRIMGEGDIEITKQRMIQPLVENN